MIRYHPNWYFDGYECLQKGQMGCLIGPSNALPFFVMTLSNEDVQKLTRSRCLWELVLMLNGEMEGFMIFLVKLGCLV